MAFVLDKVSEDSFYENMLLGITKILEKNPRIKNIHLERQLPCTQSDIQTWEQHHGVKLPDDMKDFYLATNGFKLFWSYVFSDQEVLEIGSINIHSLAEMISLTGYRVQSSAEITIVNKKLNLQLSLESKVFQLSYIDDTARVCLIYLNSSSDPTIWLADSELNWHYLSNKFIRYMRMAIAHLGLPFWQFCFTSQGVPSWVEVFLMSAPHLSLAQPYIHDSREDEREEKLDLQNYYINKLDISLFKPKQRAGKAPDLMKYRSKKH